MEIGFGPSAVNPLLRRILLIRSDSFRNRTCDLFEKNPSPYLVLLKICYLKNSITDYLMKYNWKVPFSFLFFSNAAFSSLPSSSYSKKKKSEVYNNASNYVLRDFYCLAIYYKCFCGWYKVFEQVFKLVRNVLNIGDCYYRLCFMVYGWFMGTKTKSQCSVALAALFLWQHFTTQSKPLPAEEQKLIVTGAETKHYAHLAASITSGRICRQSVFPQSCF